MNFSSTKKEVVGELIFWVGDGQVEVGEGTLCPRQESFELRVRPLQGRCHVKKKIVCRELWSQAQKLLQFP